jgi:small subunit ribosomal protein S8
VANNKKSEKKSRRKMLAERYAAKRAQLKKAAMLDENCTPEERFEARLQLTRMSRNSTPDRVRNRSEITGRFRKALTASPSGHVTQGSGSSTELTKRRPTISDPLGDMLARIRTAQMRGMTKVVTPASKLRVRVLKALAQEGYIRGYTEIEKDGHKSLEIELKSYEGQPVLPLIKRISKPSRRVYSSNCEIPLVRNMSGISSAGSMRVFSDLGIRESAGFTIRIINEDKSGPQGTSIDTFDRMSARLAALRQVGTAGSS